MYVQAVGWLVMDETASGEAVMSFDGRRFLCRVVMGDISGRNSCPVAQRVRSRHQLLC